MTYVRTMKYVYGFMEFFGISEFRKLTRKKSTDPSERLRPNFTICVTNILNKFEPFSITSFKKQKPM